MLCLSRLFGGAVHIEKAKPLYLRVGLVVSQAAVHHTCLLLAAEDPEASLTAEILERAIRLVREKSNRQECLFG